MPPDFRAQHDFPCWCGATDARIFCGQFIGKHHFLALKCSACGTHRILPRALSSQHDAESLYNEYIGCRDIAEAQEELVFQKHLQHMAAVRIQLDSKMKLIDVGCGSGAMLDRVCRNFGCAGVGLDIDRRNIVKAQARFKHASFICGTLEGLPGEATFDAVFSSAVVEHVTDPVGFLKQHRKVLADNGSLYVLTPNASSLNYWLLRSWWRELLSIGEHIYLFTPESLARCASQAGFKLVKASSGFDWGGGVSKLRWGSPRDAAIGIWTIYRSLIKHACVPLSSQLRRDILFAHFKKS
jgi:2-polyprenyl-3-methyl-5-hydroxy-6-metoxy-1,4-benzoquinol methylase